MMGNDPKRKRELVEVADSEEDYLSDPSPNARRTRHDEKVARQLQEELDREAAEAFVSGDDQNIYEDEMDEDSDDFSLADPKGKGKAVASRRPRGSRANPKKNLVLDSDEDEEEFSDSVHHEPPTKKQKTVRGKSKVPAPPLSDDDDDEDVPG